MAKRNKFTGHRESNIANASVDDLAEFEEFRATILPKLRTAIKDNKGPKDILKMVESAAAGKLATLALKERDPDRALRLITQVLDRTVGKPKESLSLTTKYDKMTDEELQALIDQEKDIVE